MYAKAYNRLPILDNRAGWTIPVVSTEIALQIPERRLVLEHYLRGVDPIVTHRSVSKTLPYEAFLRLYVDEVLAFHTKPADAKRVGLSTVGAENLKQLCEVRDKVLEALKLCVDDPIVVLGHSASGGDLTSDRIRCVASLAQAHGQTIKQIHAIYKQQLEEAAALHSLLASRSEADELEGPLDDPT